MPPGTGNADLIGEQLSAPDLERSELVAVVAPELIGGSSDEHIRRLQNRIDELTQELWQARDAVLGAEAAKGSAKARTGEVEHYLHLRTVEVEQLTEKLARLSADEPVGGIDAPLQTVRSVAGKARRTILGMSRRAGSS